MHETGHSKMVHWTIQRDWMGGKVGGEFGMGDTCTPMFIAALFIIARTWKQPRCPLADEWIRKLWYIYTMEYYSAIKKMHLNQF